MEIDEYIIKCNCTKYSLEISLSLPLSLSLSLPQSISLCLEDVLSRDIKLQLLQLLAPGRAYPERSSAAATNRRTSSLCYVASPGPGGGADDGPTSQPNGGVASPGLSPTPPFDPSAFSGQKEPHRKKFDVESLGLSWDNLDAMHFFVFPGT
jgi:hypothetical protein